MHRHVLARVVAFVSVLAGPTALSAQTLDASSREAIVAKLATALRDRYIFPEVGEAAAGAITDNAKAGSYDGLTDPAAFARRLSADLDQVAHDRHMGVRASTPPGGRQVVWPRSEAGVLRADRLPGGVGYIEVVNFPPPELFKPVIDQAMAALEGSTALIIDMRRNGGGMPASVAYLVSFLTPLSERLHINDIITREPGTTTFDRQAYVSEPTPVSFAGKPVYVLTSKGTFSGGEEFAYDVKVLRLGVVIGEVTGGGANPTGPVRLEQGLVARIPVGRARNPVTNANWEGHGVDPDTPVPAAEALGAALQALGLPPAQDISAASGEQVFAPRTVAITGSDAALAKMVTAAQAGEIPRTLLIAGAAGPMRQDLPDVQARLAGLGPIRSATFVEVDTQGADIYDVAFADGVLRCAVTMTAGGKIAGWTVIGPPPDAPVSTGPAPAAR